MANILHIETATQVCSVALSANGILLQLLESCEKNSHSATVTNFIDRVMKSAGMAFKELDAVAVSKGPGSYTGLRIGVSTAKGICYAVDKPLIAVGTLLSMAAGVREGLESRGFPTLLCPMIDARRMEVYCALYDAEGHELREVMAEIIDENSFGSELERDRIIFGGEGAEKCREVLGSRPNAAFLDGFKASARYMQGLAAGKFEKQEFGNLAYFEPFYLKDFVAGKPRVKGLH